MSIEKLVEPSASHAMSSNSDLESRTKNLFWLTIKKFSFWDWTKIGISTAAAVVFGSPLNAASFLASYVSMYYITNKKNGSVDKNGLKSEFHLANTMSVFMTHLYKALNRLSPVERTLVGFAGTIPLFNFVYLSARHIIRRYSPLAFIKRIFRTGNGIFKEIYEESLRPSYYKTTKDTYLYMGLPLAYTWNYVPVDYQLAATSAARFGYKYILEKAVQKPDTYARSNPG